MEHLAQLFNKNKPIRILDVATGRGNFINIIRRVYNDYESIIGIDSSQLMINEAIKVFHDDKRISFQMMDAKNMTFENQTFDMITISNTIHHFQNINPLFLEMKRVLKTDGIILISEMIRNDLTSMQQSHLLLHHFAAKLDRLKGQMHNETFTKNDLIQSLIELPNLKYEYSWILRYKHSKQNSDKEIKWLLDTVDHLTKGIVDSQLLDEAASIKEYIQMNGFESCPTLMVVIKNEITKNI